MNNPRFAYFGTPEFSTFVLDELASAGFLPALIITTPDKPAGRELALAQSPVKSWAIVHGIPTLQPEKFTEEILSALRDAKCDLFIVAAYGKILPQAVLDIPSRGNLNVHPSLLPRYRGTSPVESQILADEKDIGVSVILMDAEMDHGPILGKEKIGIPNWPINRNALNELLWHTGGKLLAQLLPDWIAGTLNESQQNHAEATFTKKMRKEDGEINLSDSGKANYLKYLAYEGWPGVYYFDNGKRVKIIKARFENGTFIPERIIPEGKKEQDA